MKNVSKKTFVIAEAGVNHNGSFKLAKRLVDIAYDAGADAVKFQTFHAEDLVRKNAPKAEYQKKTATQFNESQYKMLKQLELSEADQINLHQYCQSKGLLFLSSPFDLQSVDFLVRTLDLPMIKIASGEITNLPLLFTIAKTGKPVILSTGMSRLGEIETALSVLAFGYLSHKNHQPPSDRSCEEAYYSKDGQDILKEKASLLHCTSEYPAPFDEVNLRVLTTLKNAFDLTIGYSDHTSGIAISIAAVANGAEIIEKHFTVDKTLPGPDHQASLEPQELACMVKSIRQVESALGTSKKIPTSSELENRLIARKSIVALMSINKGDAFTEKNIGCKRPANGISPIHFWDISCQYAERDYLKDELIGT